MNLFPPISPYHTEYLDVGDGHTLYVEESGNRNGKPVIFLHGGPGGGSSDYHRQFFHPEKYRIIIFDQRGCGRSTPHASLENNTTWDLVGDVELIRSRYNIEKWLVFGGSWGSTLALAYAEKYPERISGMILRGIFLCRPQEIQWFYQDGANRLAPDAWVDYEKIIPKEERHDMLSAYHRRLVSDDPQVRLAAAKAWSIWEGSTSTLKPNHELVAHFGNEKVALAMARIETHYFMNECFLRENQLLEEAYRLENIPGVIVHGRYDIVCPLDQAWALNAVWPRSELRIIDDAGHSATEPGITRALVEATERMADLK